MILGLEIGMLIVGIIALARGKFSLTKKQVVEGATARVVGFVLILPLPLAFAAGFVISFGQAAQGKQVQLEDLKGTLTMVELGIVAACLIVAVAITLVSAQAPASKRPPDGGSDEADNVDTTPPSFEGGGQ
jgi:hypothetical protein